MLNNLSNTAHFIYLFDTNAKLSKYIHVLKSIILYTV